MNDRSDKPDEQPELDENALAYLHGLCSYGYEEIRPPETKAVADFLKSLDIVIDGLMDRDLGPHLADVFRAAADSGSEQRLADLVGELEELRQASQHSPPATRKGRPHLPIWMHRAARFLVDYYRERTGDPSGPYFKDEDANRPGNAFTIWFCEKLRGLHPSVTPSNCMTLIRRYGHKIQP